METIKSEQYIAKRLLKYILDGISYKIIRVRETQENAFHKEIKIVFTTSGCASFGHTHSILFTFYCDLPKDDVYVKSINIATFFGHVMFHKIYHRLRYINDMLAARVTKCVKELEIKIDLLGI